jgi:hypothetical protein
MSASACYRRLRTKQITADFPMFSYLKSGLPQMVCRATTLPP